MIPHLIKLARPKQWVKNFFVFAPLLFSKHIFEAGYVFNSFKAFFTFCIISSAVYIINDILDVDSDRSHPKKKYRPIASGEISIKQAVIFAAVLLVIVILAFLFQNPAVIFLTVLYFLWIYAKGAWRRRRNQCACFKLDGADNNIYLAVPCNLKEKGRAFTGFKP
jgi:4-hydroxybenzoate polyprenyltransferase